MSGAEGRADEGSCLILTKGEPAPTSADRHLISIIVVIVIVIVVPAHPMRGDYRNRHLNPAGGIEMATTIAISISATAFLVGLRAEGHAPLLNEPLSTAAA